MTVWTPSGQSPLSLAQGHCVSWRLSLLSRPTFSLLFLLSPPCLLQAKSSRTGRYGQNGGDGVGWADKQVQILSWDNTWGSGWSGPHQGLSLSNSHALAKGADNGPRAAPAGRVGASSASQPWFSVVKGASLEGRQWQARRGPKNAAASDLLKFSVKDPSPSLNFLLFLPFPLRPSQSPRTKSNSCTGGSSS